jgi:hypothetical protein
VTTLTIYRRTSRGKYTFGFNIVGIIDENTGTRHRVIGGGYDMVGTVIGMWLNKNYSDRLQNVNGACGRATVYKIAETVGLKITENWNERGKMVSVTVTDTL